MVLSDRAIALTRRPVKDKGALMQTLHLWFRALRAISLGQSPGRWPSPSLRAASKWETASPLPNPLRPTSAVGSRPARSRQRLARCPTVGAGLPLASPLREVRVGASAHPGRSDGAATNRVCPRQTASDLSPYPAPHEAGDLGTDHWQARSLVSQRLASGGLSFPLRPRRFRAHSCGEKTAGPIANVRASARISSGAWARLHHRRGEGAWPATTSP
ncbi:hypothetical protein SAMN05421764_1254 [Donghicola eburneus]|nr:hypothetical protein SAMN05421764_1254 [Donghicola eburneus]